VLDPERVEERPLEIGYGRVLVDQHQAHQALPCHDLLRDQVSSLTNWMLMSSVSLTWPTQAGREGTARDAVPG
jgi:hypothetical protein